MMSLFLLVLGLALVTYLPRLVPLLWLKELALPAYMKRFLSFIPYAVLASLIFPGVLSSTTTTTAALFGGVVATTLALLRVNLVVVVIGAVFGVYVFQTLS